MSLLKNPNVFQDAKFIILAVDKSKNINAPLFIFLDPDRQVVFLVNEPCDEWSKTGGFEFQILYYTLYYTHIILICIFVQINGGKMSPVSICIAYDLSSMDWKV